MLALERAERGSRRRLSIEPLLERLEADSVAAAARRLDVDRTRLYQWRRAGLTVARADVLAIAAGFHPGEVWPEWWQLATTG